MTDELVTADLPVFGDHMQYYKSLYRERLILVSKTTEPKLYVKTNYVLGEIHKYTDEISKLEIAHTARLSLIALSLEPRNNNRNNYYLGHNFNWKQI